jgi:hypothetical protein
MIQSAFGGRSGGNIFGTGGPDSNVGGGSHKDALAEVENVAPARKVSVARSMMAPASRKSSVSTGA